MSHITRSKARIVLNPGPGLSSACADALKGGVGPGAPRRMPVQILTHRTAEGRSESTFNQYWQLVTLAAVLNAAILVHGISRDFWLPLDGPALALIGNIALINITVGILMRQQRIINALFWLVTRVPTTWPLWIRWTAGKVYNYGGLHIGATVAGSLWFAAFTVGTVLSAAEGSGVSTLTAGASLALVALLLAIIFTALAPMRERRHDRFERVHRFGGWTALLLFWVQSASFALDMGQSFVGGFAFWALCLVTVSVALPWLRLKRVSVEIIKPSSHAVIVRLDYGRDAFPGSFNAISLCPLMEWHSFAAIPAPRRDDHRLIISRAGDWTGSFIDNPPSHVWVKGIATAGAARVGSLFTRVVYVATGSGIGPILPHLLAREAPFHLIWVTRDPWKTYGDALCDEILAACPEALIWDTDARGKPDLAALAMQAAQGFGAEAVIVISNPKVAWHLTAVLEREGIPAFSPIWDS
jgi:hypothetical protein